jgi:hypothetical protein
MGGMPSEQLEILVGYLTKLKAAYAEKEKEQNGKRTESGKA